MDFDLELGYRLASTDLFLHDANPAPRNVPSGHPHDIPATLTRVEQQRISEALASP